MMMKMLPSPLVVWDIDNSTSHLANPSVDLRDLKYFNTFC